MLFLSRDTLVEWKVFQLTSLCGLLGAALLHTARCATCNNTPSAQPRASASRTTWTTGLTDHMSAKMMADPLFHDWALLKWLILSLLVASFAFRHTIYAYALSERRPYITTNKATMTSRADNIHEIYHIVFLLQQRLVRDVIPAIIEYAELYECTPAERRSYPHHRVSQYEAPMRLLICDVTQPLARVLRPVRKIVFRINSHDQGFASDPNAGSWTWFSAQKLPAVDQDCQISGAESSGAVGVREYRELYRNPVADRRWVTHEVTWRADSDNSAEAEWVSSLKGGDRFAVYAWARYPAWVNHISDISVVLYTAAIA